jgi:hypothetical protein
MHKNGLIMALCLIVLAGISVPAQALADEEAAPATSTRLIG